MKSKNIKALFGKKSYAISTCDIDSSVFQLTSDPPFELYNLTSVTRCQFHQRFSTSFYKRRYPKSAKKTDNLTVFFPLSGSGLVKAARRTLIKLTPGAKESLCR